MGKMLAFLLAAGVAFAILAPVAEAAGVPFAYVDFRSAKITKSGAVRVVADATCSPGVHLVKRIRRGGTTSGQVTQGFPFDSPGEVEVSKIRFYRWQVACTGNPDRFVLYFKQTVTVSVDGEPQQSQPGVPLNLYLSIVGYVASDWRQKVSGDEVDHLILPAGKQLSELPAPEGTTVRHDPDDSLSPLDIRRVGTAMSSGGKAFFGVWTDNRIYPFYLDVADGSYFQFSLDTYGGPEVDRNVYLFYRSPDHRTKKPRLQCLVADQEGQVLAHRYVEWTGHELACQLPAQEFSIEKTVEFSVDAYSFGFWQDRAPDEGLYQGL